jgi:excisionase family DNA binding protein
MLLEGINPAILLLHNGTYHVSVPARRNRYMSDTARLNSVKDVMVKTRLSRSKLYEELACGRLKSVKVGRRRLVTESQLIDYIAKLTEASAAPSGGTT